MWTTLELVSDAIEKSMDKEAKHHLLKTLYARMNGGHYDKEYAIQDSAKMYYKDKAGNRHAAPYWTEEQVREIYDGIKSEIRGYNCWDFFVALNMVKSDNCPLLERWFPGITPEEKTKKLVDMTINWLNDEDNPYGNTKLWDYLNPEK